MECYRSEDLRRVAIVAATWELNPNRSEASFEEAFRKNPAKAWRDYGAKPSHAVEKFFRDPTLVDRYIDTSLSNAWDSETKWFHDGWKPTQGVEYFIHFDLAHTQDAVGCGITCYDRNRDVYRVDGVIRLQAPPGGEIDFAGLRPIVYEVTKRGGLVSVVSYDQFQSVETRQQLKRKGYRVEYISMDRKTEGYDTFKEIWREGKVECPWHHVLVRELKQLERLRGTQIEHPRGGSKDVADGVAGSIYSAVQFRTIGEPKRKGEVREKKGAGFTSKDKEGLRKLAKRLHKGRRG